MPVPTSLPFMEDFKGFSLLKETIPSPENIKFPIFARPLRTFPLKFRLRSSTMRLEELAKGKSLSEVLRATGVFPSLFISLLATGERSGELEKALDLLEETYDRLAMRKINLWVRLAEPMAMLLIGLLIAFVVLSVILPITEISGGVRR